MQLASPAVGIYRRQLARRVGLAAAALAIVALHVMPVVVWDYRLEFGIPLVGAIGSVVAIVLARTSRARRGTVGLTERSLLVSREGDARSLPLDEMVGALVREPRLLEIGLRNGDVLSVALSDVADGHRFIRELEERGLQRSLSIRVRQPWLSWAPLSTTAALQYLLGIVAVSCAMLSGWWIKHPLGLVVAEASSILWMWVAVHAWASRGLALGADGITISRAFSAQFLPWSRVRGTQWRRGRLFLVLSDGSEIPLSRWKRTPPATATLIDRALVRAGAPSSAEPVAALERAGREIGAWRASLRELAGGDSTYRGVQLTRDMLQSVLEDGAAPAERRIAAALALRESDADAGRIRIVAESCANEHLRIALEKAAADELDVAAVEDAARAAGG